MPITVAHTPSAEVIARSAYIGGLGEWQEKQKEIELQQEELRQRARSLQLQLRDRQISQAQAQKHQKEMTVLNAQLGELERQKEFVRTQARDYSLHQNTMEKARLEAGTDISLQGMRGEQGLAEIGARQAGELEQLGVKGQQDIGLEIEKSRLKEQSDVAAMVRKQAMNGWEYDERARRELDKYDADEKQINEDDTLTPYEKEQAYRELNFKRMGIQPTGRKSPYPEGQQPGMPFEMPLMGSDGKPMGNMLVTRDMDGNLRVLHKPDTPDKLGKPSFSDVSKLVNDAIKAATDETGGFNEDRYDMVLNRSVELYKRMTGADIELPQGPAMQNINILGAKFKIPDVGAMQQGQQPQGTQIPEQTQNLDPETMRVQALRNAPEKSQVTPDWINSAIPGDDKDAQIARDILHQVTQLGVNPASDQIYKEWNLMSEKGKALLTEAFFVLGITKESLAEISIGNTKKSETGSKSVFFGKPNYETMTERLRGNR